MTKFKGKKTNIPQEDESLMEDAVNTGSVDIDNNVDADADANMDINENEQGNTADSTLLTAELEKKLNKKEQECEEYLDMLKRSKAEFDNYRKRTIKEKDSIYVDGFTDGIKQILPVIDNLERALAYANPETAANGDSLLQGVEMVLKMFSDTLVKTEVEELPSVGSSFDPEVHNAVMHVVDENYGENVVVEVLQKGYKYKDKIIRHSMVKVAN